MNGGEQMAAMSEREERLNEIEAAVLRIVSEKDSASPNEILDGLVKQFDPSLVSLAIQRLVEKRDLAFTRQRRLQDIKAGSS